MPGERGASVVRNLLCGLVGRVGGGFHGTGGGFNLLRLVGGGPGRFFLRLIHRAANLVLNIAGGLLEFADGFSHGAKQLRKAFGSEQEENDETDDDQLGHADLLQKSKNHDG